METINFDNIIHNSFYQRYNSDDFNDLFLQLLIINEENNGIFPFLKIIIKTFNYF